MNERKKTNTQRLLDRARVLCNPPTDYQIAKLLGVDPQNVHNWIKRGSAMDLTTAYTLADLLREDRSIVAGLVELDKKNLSPEKRRRLEQLLPRNVASACFAVGLALLAALMCPQTARASSAGVTNQAPASADPLYIMRTRRMGRACRFLVAVLAGWLGARRPEPRVIAAA